MGIRFIENMSWHTGMRLVALGLLMIGIALAFPRIPSLSGHFSPNGIDFVQGLCFGLAIAFEISGIAAMVVKRKRYGN